MFYHISRKYLGDNPRINPKVPETGDINEEGNIPRICVSTSPYFCLKAIVGCSQKYFFVRKIINELRAEIQPMQTLDEWIATSAVILSPAVYSCKVPAFTPPNCSDFRENQEHWYISPQTFKLEGFIDLQHLVDTCEIKIVDKQNTLPSDILASTNALSNQDFKVKKPKKEKVKGK